MKTSRRVGIVALVGVALVLAYVVAGEIERDRIGEPLPHPATTSAGAPAVDAGLLMTDLRTLASPQFAGRRTGTEGSRLAQAYITRRFEENGVQPFGDTFAMRFAFTHTSIKGLLTPGRKMKTAYPLAVNLVGHIPGSASPERYMVVSAHYDHFGVRDGETYLGADDNASGVAAMLAVAAHFRQYPPKNTIVFVAFDSEELGLRGARAFVNAAPFPIAQTALNLNFDMISRSATNEIYAAGASYKPELAPLVAKAAATSSVKVRLGHDRSILIAGSVENWTSGSDHIAFHEIGIPFLYFGVEDHPDYHKPGDTVEKIDPKFFAEVARLLVSTAVVLDQNLDALK